MKTLRIESPSHGRGDVWIDGEKQEGITSVSLSIKVGEANKVTLGRSDDRIVTEHIVGKLDIDFAYWESSNCPQIVDPFEPIAERMARDAIESIRSMIAEDAREAHREIAGWFRTSKRQASDLHEYQRRQLAT